MLSLLFGLENLPLLAILGSLVLVSSVLQTATGFGFALLLAPIAAALVGGPTAVGMVLIAGTAVDLLIIGTRRKLPRPEWTEVVLLAGFSFPGIAVGTVLLAVAARPLLLALMAVVVAVAVVLLWLTRRPGQRPIVRRRWAALAGLVSGAFGTATTIAGPPSVFYLAHRPYSPPVVRDTLVTVNLVRLPVSIFALTVGGVFVVLPGIGWLVVAAVVGHLAGRAVFARMSAARYDAAVLGLLLLSAVTAAALAVFTN